MAAMFRVTQFRALIVQMCPYYLRLASYFRSAGHASIFHGQVDRSSDKRGKCCAALDRIFHVADSKKKKFSWMFYEELPYLVASGRIFALVIKLSQFHVRRNSLLGFYMSANVQGRC